MGFRESWTVEQGLKGASRLCEKHRDLGQSKRVGEGVNTRPLSPPSFRFLSVPLPLVNPPRRGGPWEPGRCRQL